MLRLKTGTPMRLDKHTIDWAAFRPSRATKSPCPSPSGRGRLENKVLCYMGYTNDRTHDVIRKNLDKSPLYSGIIKGIGPRYCPSIEDKVVKFPHHARHQFFLEPEGLETSEVYVNGMSSSLPFEVQRDILKTIPGLDKAKILQAGLRDRIRCRLPDRTRHLSRPGESKTSFSPDRSTGPRAMRKRPPRGSWPGSMPL